MPEKFPSILVILTNITVMIKYKQCGNDLFFCFMISLYPNLHINRKKVIIISLGGIDSLIFWAVSFIEFEECSLFFPLQNILLLQEF